MESLSPSETISKHAFSGRSGLKRILAHLSHLTIDAIGQTPVRQNGRKGADHE